MAESYIKQRINYIKKNLSKGYTEESLRWALIKQGYSRTEVDKAIKLANEELANEAPKFIEKPVIKVEAEPLAEQPKISLWQKFKGLFG